MVHHDPRELAHVFALKRGMALVVRQGDLYGVYPDGSSAWVCHVTQGKDFWVRVCLILTERFPVTKHPFILTTPHGSYSGDTLFHVLKKVLCGDLDGVEA